MDYKIYLRPLRKEDAAVSFHWRNDAEVWQFTGNRPDREITYDIEKKWIEKKLKIENERRYAICLYSNDKYIGNVQLTNIKNKTAEFHIFIGDKRYWGKGIGKEATKKIIELGFNVMRLKEIYLEAKRNNIAAVKESKKNGFYVSDSKGTKLLMKIKNL